MKMWDSLMDNALDSQWIHALIEETGAGVDPIRGYLKAGTTARGGMEFAASRRDATSVAPQEAVLVHGSGLVVSRSVPP